MLTQQRHEIILKLLKEKGSITVTEVRDLLDTSESTVRRDITALDKEGKLEKVFGGAVPKNYFPAVEKGVREAMSQGILAGYPLGNIKVTLYDGSYHPVDSNEMAFKIAGSMGFRSGATKADPVILEPYMKVEVTVPEDYMGDVIGDLNSRRGRIEGMEARNGAQVINAFVPLSEMFGYATDLRSKTQGRGNYSMEVDHYEDVPRNIAEAIIAKNKGTQA